MIAAILSIGATLLILERWRHLQATRRLVVVRIPVTRR